MADARLDLRLDARLLRTALALGLAAAVSLGLARFSYALLLPPMRAELGWSYFTAGAMNTVNAAGYLAGALLAPQVLARWDARRVMLAGGCAAGVLLAAHGAVHSDAALFALRAFTGLASAAGFVGGGLLAARLATQPGAPAGLVLGLYYGGTGLGIVLSALGVPVLGGRAGWGWVGVLSLLATAITALGTRALSAPPLPGAARAQARLKPLAYGLAGYTLFGMGYIGYMTFIVTLLREQGLAAPVITAFYAVLGLGVVASSWLWAGLLQRHRSGRPQALLNGLLALATVLPVLSSHPVLVFVSGALFGSVFLSVVASTTALVRHNLAPAAWASGIAAFTVVFALGQIVGPSLVGFVADAAATTNGGVGMANRMAGGLFGGLFGGLSGGLLLSAGVLALGSLLASRQRALPVA